MTVLTVSVRGIPAPQGSKRLVNGRMIEASRAVGPWREAVRHETQTAIAAGGGTFPDGPVHVVALFTLARPKSHLRVDGGLRKGAPLFPAGLVDLDKLCRALGDGLVAGGALGDDRQIVTWVAHKRYGQTPGVDVRLTAMADL